MSRLAVTMISGSAFWLLSVQGDVREPIRAPVSDGHLKKVKSYVELDPIPEYQHASEEAYEKFRDLKFGIRIHWGVYAMWARDDASWTLYQHLRAEKQQYNELYKTWNPKGFDAEQWMRFFERSGIRIFAFTTKHCDGFSMFDTKTRVKGAPTGLLPDGPKLESCDLAYSIMESPFRRDVVKELCDAAHRHNMKIDLYFTSSRLVRRRFPRLLHGSHGPSSARRRRPSVPG